MLYYYRIYISERTDPTKSNKSRKCMTCHYSFFNHGFKLQNYVCNGSHDLTMLSVNKVTLLLSLLKMLIIDVLFITLANLKQSVY